MSVIVIIYGSGVRMAHWLDLLRGGEASSAPGAAEAARGGLQSARRRAQEHDFSTEQPSVLTCCLFCPLPTLFHAGSVLLFPTSPSTLQETFY